MGTENTMETELLYLKSIIKNSKDPMYAKDVNYIYIAASDSYAKLFGYGTGEEIVGLDDFEVTGSTDTANNYRKSDYQVMTTGKPIMDSLIESKHSKSSLRCKLSTSKYPIKNADDEIIGMCGVCKDVTTEENLKKISDTYKKAYDTIAEESKSKSDFLVRLSHDVRTSLNSIMGMATIAEGNMDDKTKMKDSFAVINESSKHLIALLNQVLDIEKIESGTVELNVCDFDINAFLNNFTAIMQPKAKEKDLSFTVKAENVKHPRVTGDPTRIEQVFANLVSNSINFTDPGGTIRITLKELKANKDDQDANLASFEIQFEDTGIGMSEELMSRLFVPFASRKIDTVIDGSSMGLGLAATKKLVNMMGGDITVESHEGVGSKFTVTMKLLIAKDDEEEFEKSDILKDTTNFAGKRALIVEDNDLNAEIAVELVGMMGMKAEVAENGKIALEKFKKSKKGYYDIILMDVQMPVMNGYDATREIRLLDRADAQDIPIIAMTANAFVSDVSEAMQAGMNEHLSKPIAFEKLVSTMARWI